MKLFDCVTLKDLETVLQTVHPDAEREYKNPKGRTLLAKICHCYGLGTDPRVTQADQYVELLLRYGADPNDISNPLGNFLNTQGPSVPVRLPHGVRLRILKLLLEYGLDVNNTPYTLHGAVSYDLRFSSQEDQEIISLLIQNGASRINKDTLNQTPFEQARSRLAIKFNNSHNNTDLAKYNQYFNDTKSPGYKNWQTIMRTLDPTSSQQMDIAVAKKAAETKKAQVAPKIKQQRDDAQRKVELAKQAEAARQAEEARKKAEAAKAEAEKQAKLEAEREAEIKRLAEETARKAEIARQEAQRQAELARQAEEARKAEAERQAKLEEKRQAEIERQAEEAAKQAEIARQEAQKQAELVRQAEEARKVSEAAKKAETEKPAQLEAQRQAELKTAEEKLAEREKQSGFVLLMYGPNEVTEYWYRGTKSSPTKVFTHGFIPRGTNMDLVDHVHGEAGDSGYVPLSTSKDVAMSFPKQPSSDVFLYEIRMQPGAVNVEMELPEVAENILHPEDIDVYIQERERAVPHKIQPRDIKGAWRVEVGLGGLQLDGDLLLDENRYVRRLNQSFISNPAYEPEYKKNTSKPFTLPNTQPWKSINTAGKAVTLVGAGLDAFSLQRAYQESQRTGDNRIFFNESARVMGAWTGAVAMSSAFAEIGAGIGSFFAPGPGTAVGAGTGALIGGLFGSIGGSIAGYSGGGKITSALGLDLKPHIPVFIERLKGNRQHSRRNWVSKPKKNNAYNELIEKIEENRARQIMEMIASKHNFGSHLAFKIFLQNHKNLDINAFKQQISIAKSRSKHMPGIVAVGRRKPMLFASQTGKHPIKINRSKAKSSGFQRKSRTNAGHGINFAMSSKFSSGRSSKGSTTRAKPSSMQTVDKQSSRTTMHHNQRSRPRFKDEKRFNMFMTGSSAKKESPSTTVGLNYRQQSHASRPNHPIHHSNDFINGFFAESKRPNHTGSREQVTVGGGWGSSHAQQQKSKTISADRWRWRQYAKGTSHQEHAKLIEKIEQDRADKIQEMIASECSFGSYAGFGIFLNKYKDLSMEEFKQQIQAEQSNLASKKSNGPNRQLKFLKPPSITTRTKTIKIGAVTINMDVRQISNTSTSSKQNNSGQVNGVSSGMGGGGTSGSY